MHRLNDLPWISARRDTQEPLQSVLRKHGRPVKKDAALTLDLLRMVVAICDRSRRGRRDRALLLIGFARALRRYELVALHVENVALVGNGLRMRILRGKTDKLGQERRSGCRAANISKPALGAP